MCEKKLEEIILIYLTNIVTESYKETMFNIINDNKNEIYQEREICAPNMSETTETKQNDNG